MTAAEAHHLTMPFSDMVLCGDGSDPARHSKHAHTHGQSGSGSVQWQTYHSSIEGGHSVKRMKFERVIGIRLRGRAGEVGGSGAGVIRASMSPLGAARAGSETPVGAQARLLREPKEEQLRDSADEVL